MKETYYFTHDYNARTDSKIKNLIRKHGYLGYGLFWAIIEDLYNNANALRTDCEGIAFDLHSDKETIKSILYDFDLFVFEGDYFGSLSVQRRIEQRDEKSKKARDSAFKRWNKDANALQTHSEGNAIKKRKRKEIKESKEKKRDYLDFYSLYPLKKGKIDCENAWKKLKPEEWQPAIDGIKKLIENCDPKYYPHPATYLNGKRWTDEYIKKTDLTLTSKTLPKADDYGTTHF